MTNLAAADGAIGCWNDKWYWSFWRPITAIRAAADDGNPATEADPTWVPLFDPTVPVSGPPPAPCPSRSFDRLSVALREIIEARVWGGIHFRTADVQGSVLGKKVAHYLEKYYFQPAN